MGDSVNDVVEEKWRREEPLVSPASIWQTWVFGGLFTVIWVMFKGRDVAQGHMSLFDCIVNWLVGILILIVFFYYMENYYGIQRNAKKRLLNVAAFSRIAWEKYGLNVADSDSLDAFKNPVPHRSYTLRINEDFYTVTIGKTVAATQIIPHETEA